MDDEVLYIKSQCHCGIGTFRVAFERARLPFANQLCHCDTCRHVSGEMAFYHLPIEGPPCVGTLTTLHPVDPRTTDLTAYQSSPNTLRYFCHNCSCHMFMCVNETEWYVAGGSLETLEGIAKLSCHVNVADTMDGGLTNQISSVEGKNLPRYAHKQGSVELPIGWRSEKLKNIEQDKDDSVLRAYCHCGSIDVYVTRPNMRSAAPHAAFPDIIYPLPQTRLATIRNAKDVKWWLRPLVYTDESGKLVPVPVTPGSPISGEPSRPGTPEPTQAVDSHTRYLAGHCVCSHCRQSSGFDIQSWVFVSRINVFQTDTKKPLLLGSDVEGDRPKGLKQYSSSPGRYHEFCGTCGATAFWWLNGRPDVIDISVGMLDQSIDGVCAQNWVKWHKERLSFIEKSLVNKELVHGLKDGLAKMVDPIFGQA